MMDIPLQLLTSVKKQRNQARGAGTASYNRPFSIYDAEHPANRVTIMVTNVGRGEDDDHRCSKPRKQSEKW